MLTNFLLSFCGKFRLHSKFLRCRASISVAKWTVIPSCCSSLMTSLLRLTFAQKRRDISRELRSSTRWQRRFVDMRDDPCEEDLSFPWASVWLNDLRHNTRRRTSQTPVMEPKRRKIRTGMPKAHRDLGQKNLGRYCFSENRMSWKCDLKVEKKWSFCLLRSPSKCCGSHKLTTISVTWGCQFLQVSGTERSGVQGKHWCEAWAGEALGRIL